MQYRRGSDVGNLYETVLTWLDSTACTVALYVVAGSTALLLGVVEQHRGGATDPRRWPMFWFATGGLLFVMAAGRASNISDLLTDIGREQARPGGWCEVRRSLQAWVIGAVAASWAMTVAVAVWRVPERRRRYLPFAIVVFTLVCYAGMRLISLRQVDAPLHIRDLRGVTIGSIIEVAILLLVVIVSAWRFRGANSGRPDELAGIHVDVTNFRRSGDAVSAAGRPTAEANSSHRLSAPDLHVRRLLPVDAMFTLMSFLRVHGWRLPDVLTNECTTLSQIANNIPVYEVTIPWGLDHRRCRLSTSEMLIAVFAYFLWWPLNDNDADDVVQAAPRPVRTTPTVLAQMRRSWASDQLST